MLAWCPWILLAAGALATWLLYPALPESWAIHYDAAGVADGWVTRSPPAALAPLVLGVICSALLELVGRIVPVRPPFPLEEPWRLRLQAWHRDSLRAVSCAIAGLLVVTALALPWVRSPHFLLLPVAALVGVALFVPAVMLHRLLAAMAQAGILPRGYAGLTYRNPDDPRLLVPRLTGGGYTLNFAHPQAWLCLAGLVLAPLAVLALLAWWQR